MPFSLLRKHIGYRIFVAVLVCVVVSTVLISWYFVEQQRRSLVVQHRATLETVALATIQGVHAIMLSGNAEMARRYADNQKLVPGLSDFRIVRTDGREAFQDNRTIEDVNTRRGSEDFTTRDDEREVVVVQAEETSFQKAIREKAVTHVYRDDESGRQTLTFFAPITNDRECFRCHGRDHEVRGVVKITSEMDKVEGEVRATWVKALLALPVLAIAIGLIGLVVRRLTQPILGIAEELQKIGEGRGDLSVRLNSEGEDEVALLGRGFNTFVAKIEGVVNEVAQITTQLARTADELAAGTGEASRRTQQQREDTENISNAMQEMATSVQHVVSRSAEGAVTARRVESDSAEGMREMQRALEATENLVDSVNGMAALGDQLRQGMDSIGGIVVTIREIADQTNLLSLNAAIEAARAGEQGRGFAVVADEVRKLAERSGRSTHEISEIIKTLREQVARTVDAVDGGRTMAVANLDQVRKTSAALESISAAAREISALSQIISKSMESEHELSETMRRRLASINTSTEASTSDAADTAERSRALAGLSERLKHLVTQFKR